MHRRLRARTEPHLDGRRRLESNGLPTVDRVPDRGGAQRRLNTHSMASVAYIEGRDYVLPEDIKEVALDVMNHRILLNYEAEADNVKTADIVKALLQKVPISK